VTLTLHTIAWSGAYAVSRYRALIPFDISRLGLLGIYGSFSLIRNLIILS
jgi:hypothetical protein